jgi:hypothetical protein
VGGLNAFLMWLRLFLLLPIVFVAIVVLSIDTERNKT